MSYVDKFASSLGPRTSTDAGAPVNRDLLKHGGDGDGDGFGGNTTMTMSGSSPTPSQVSQTLSSTSTNKGAIAGGTVGGVAGLTAIAGLLWWTRRRRLRKRLGGREKVEIDPSYSTPAPGAPQSPAANLAAPPESQHDTRELRNEGVGGAPEPTQGPPRYWQVHNSSLPSLQQQETLPEKLVPPNSPSSSGPSAAALSTISTIGHSAPDDAPGPDSTETHTNPFSESEFISESPTSPTSSSHLSSSHLTRATSLGSASVALSAESEVLQLRRQVELLTQENARLSVGHAEMLRGEAPPAYVGRDDDDEEEE